MTPPDAALVDPIDTVVSVVTAVDPTLAPEQVRRIVEQIGGGRAKLRRLATTLAADASVLVSGRSPAPKVVGDLLLALRAAGTTTISVPWCADCGREITSMQRRGEDWYCPPCFVRPQSCASCGQERQVAFRDRHGRPRCSQCPDHDDRDPHRVLVGLITALDPGLTADTVTAVITAIVTKPAHEQKLAWALEHTPELLTGEGAKAPFPMVLRLIDALHDAGATHIQRPACPRCRRVVTLSKRRGGLRICRNCYAQAHAVACSQCGTVREPATRDAHGQPLCPHCFVNDPINRETCAGCGRRQRVSTRTPDGPFCATCAPRTISTCSVCGQTGPCMTSKTTRQPWCGACARSWAECSRCGQRAAIRAGTRDAPLCAECAVPEPGFWKTCTGCGTTGRLIAGACSRCHLHHQLRELLADTRGQICPELRVLHDTLASVDRPTTALNWLKHPSVRSVLAELATGQRRLSHATLDELPPSKPIEHLRSVLVAAAALPARDEHLARIERWVTHTINARSDPDDKEVLQRYAVWHLLRRLRQRNNGTDTTYGQLDVVRRRVRAALGLLDWLRTRGLTLATCHQADLDTLLTSKTASHRPETGHFVRWAISQRLNRNLQFAATRWTGPAQPLDQEERWHQAKRLLHDDTLDTDDRVAGLLLLLYAQCPAAISRLTLNDINISDDTVELHLGSIPVELPEPWQLSPATWSPRGAATPPSATKEPRTGYFPADNPAVPSAPTDSANASAKSDFDPAKPDRPHCSNSPPNSPPPHWPACSASTSQSPSPGSTSPQATGPTTQPTSAAGRPGLMHTPTRRTDQSSATTQGDPLPRSTLGDLWRKVVVATSQWTRTTVQSMRRRPALLVTFAAVGVIGILILLLGPLAHWATVAETELQGKEKADAVNATRQILLAAVGGSTVLIGLGFTARTYYLSRRGQFTERYTQAITQLASDKITERFGGIYALEHLMAESERDHTTVVEVLAAFIRERTNTGQDIDTPQKHVHNGQQPDFRSLAIDVQAALTALGRRPQRSEPNPINLSSTDLCGADISNLRLDGANLWSAKLQRTVAHGVRLKGANLCWVEIQDTRLGLAQLQGAHFVGAQMQEVTLNDAQLQGADLCQAKLQHSNLCDANLQNTRLGGANLQEANLAGTNLHGADLTTLSNGKPAPPRGLTPTQLADAVLDNTTQLPANLRTELLHHLRQQLYCAIIRYRHQLADSSRTKQLEEHA